MNDASKVYLGDAVYAEIDRWPGGERAVVLTTEDGISETNRIVLEPDVYAALLRFMEADAAAQRDRRRG